MMIPMIQHDRAQHRDPRSAEQFFSTQCQTPVRRRDLLRDGGQVFICGADTLLESRVNLIKTIRFRRVEIGLRSVELIELSESRQIARNACNMEGQLPERHRFGMCLQDSLSGGTRSSTRLVVTASSRSSLNIASVA